MRKVLEGEKVSRTMTTENNIVTVHHVTESGRHGDVELDSLFDFADVTETEKERLASATLVIRIRPALKKFGGTFEELESKYDGQVISVREYLDTKRRKEPLSKKQQLEKLLAEMDPDEKEASLKAELEKVKKA